MQRRSAVTLVVAVCVVLSGCAAVTELAEEFEPGSGGVEGADYQVTVVGVVDGDTVEIRYQNGTVETARLIGVDTPEVHVAVDPPEFGVENTTAGRECLRAAGHEASRFSKERLLGEQVGVSFDPNLDKRGYYGRLLVYVVTENGTHNYDLIESGQARVYESDFTDRSRYETAEEDARADGTGVWRCAAGESIPTATATDSGGSTSASGLRVASVTADPDGPDGEVLNEETVTLENAGNESLQLTGWTLADAADHTYTFGNLTLAPGEQVTVHTGSGTDTATDRYWGASSPLWNNDGDTVIVRDAEGSVVLQYQY